MTKKKRAFTTGELITAISIIIILTALTIASALDKNKTDEANIASFTKNFYSNIKTIYSNILVRHADNYDIKKLDLIGELTESELLKTYFSRYLEGQDTSCQNLIIQDEEMKKMFKREELRCINTRQNMIVGFYLNTNCNNAWQFKEFYTQENYLKTVDNACGYVIYSTNLSKKFKGIWGLDVFAIPLGQKGLK